MVGRYEQVVIERCQTTEEFLDRRMAEPGKRDAAVGRLVACQFAHHATLGTSVAQDVDKVNHKDIERGTQGSQLGEEFVNLG